MARFELSRNVVEKEYEKLLPVADMVSYSMKTNPMVGRVLEELTNCRFSLHSLEGLSLLEEKERAIYFAQGWDGDEVSSALEQGVDTFVVDNEQDLDTLLEVLEGTSLGVTLYLRIKLKEHTVHTGKRYVFGFWTKKANELIPELEHHENVKALGLHMHRKTQNVSEWDIEKELENSVEPEVFKIIDWVNVGGGLPAVYKNYRAENLDFILKKLRGLRTWLNEKDVEMVVEPGRFIAAPAINLVAEVKAKYENNLVVDCSIFNSAMDTFLENIRLLVKGEKESGDAYTIKGCTPDSRDIFRYKVFLDNPDVGDELVFLNAGAYNFSTDFCFLPELETRIVD